MADLPVTRAQWRSWVRAVKPGEVRKLAGIKQEDLAGQISTASGVQLSSRTLGFWERGISLPRENVHGVIWYEAVMTITGQGTAVSNVYVVITEDHHTDTDVAVFADERAALGFAWSYLDGMERTRENIEDSVLSPSMVRDGWTAYLPYGTEGDNIRIVRRELRSWA